MTRTNRQWKLAKRPEGAISEGDLELVPSLVADLEDGQALIRNIYLSLDPTNRIWMSDMDQYMPPVEIGQVMRGGTLGVVEESRNPAYPEGALVSGLGSWQDYAVVPADFFQTFEKPAGVPLTAFQGVLGMIGATAYFGLLDICDPKEGETVVVTAAAGAVGSLVGQIAKIKGCHVVGIAGADEKCEWLRSLGFDAAINYKTENVLETLKQHCPKGIDVVFENVGGEILDASLTLINQNARISLCGLIAEYNAEGPVPGPYMFRNILMKRARVQGFIVTDFAPRFPEAIGQLAQWMAEGRLQYRVDVVDGLENAPSAVKKLFDGSNKGKLMIRVSEEP